MRPLWRVVDAVPAWPMVGDGTLLREAVDDHTGHSVNRDALPSCVVVQPCSILAIALS